MAKLVILRLKDGNFEQGFSQVTIEIRWSDENNQGSSQQLRCHLLQAPQIPSLYQSWLKKYDALLNSPRAGFEPTTEQVSISPDVIAKNFAKDFADCSRYAQSLKKCLNQWLNPIREQLRTLSFNTHDEIHCIIQTQKMTDAKAKNILDKLPWHLSNLFPENCSAEFALSFIEPERRPAFDSTSRLKRLPRDKMLCILGYSGRNIDVEADRRLIRKLSGVYAVFLRQPTHEELKSYLRERWDIIFFSGHSETSKDGQTVFLKINDSEPPLDIRAIREDIQRTGIQLVFLNSCDGLGLVRQLADLNIPQMLVWRELVPDCVAQQFLNSFLNSFFAKGKSLYRSMQEARQDLESMEKELKLPGVSWLPIIHHNPAEESITWQTSRGYTDAGIIEDRGPYRKRIARRQSLLRKLSSWMGRLLNHDFQKTPREILLDQVKEDWDWVKDVLETSLHIQETIELGLDAVEQPSRMAWETPNQQKRNLPPGTRAIDKFDELENKRTLAILGEPGSGKTIALLEIARELLDDARQDVTLPIPVVLNLSSWSSERRPQPFANWLVQEINRTYDLSNNVSQSQVQAWLKNEQLLLLLDGLDEIKVYDLDQDPVTQNVEQTVKQQESCIRAINQFMREYGQIDMAVCSRLKDYEALSEKLQFSAAIYLNLLTKDQVDLYLHDASKELAAARELRKEYPKFLKIVESPLMLNFIAVAYQGKSREELKNLECLLKELEKNSSETIEEELLENLRQELIKTYVQRRFETK